MLFGQRRFQKVDGHAPGFVTQIKLDALWQELQDAPYGYYNCMACGYILGFLLRYVCCLLCSCTAKFLLWSILQDPERSTGFLCTLLGRLL